MPTAEDFKRAALDALGVGAGFLASDFAGELAAKAAKLTKFSKAGLKILIRLIFFVLGVFAGTATYGITSVFLFMFGVGALAGIFVDLLSAIVPGGISAVVTSLMVRELNVAEEEIIARSVESNIEAGVRW